MGIGTFPVEPGQTPLSDEEKLGLIPGYIVTLGELNEWEAGNILNGHRWAQRQKKKDILHENFIRQLHRHMFGEVWEWAGEYRKSDKNIGGVPAHLIATELREALNHVRYLESQNIDPRQIAIELHHRVVKVHPFPNGNGRLTRFLADLYLKRKGQRPFTWGGGRDVRWESELKTAYIDALKAADNLDYSSLLHFAES